MFQGAVEGMQVGEGYRELLLARVAVGEVADLGKKTDRTLKFPPKRDDASGLRCASLRLGRGRAFEWNSRFVF